MVVDVDEARRDDQPRGVDDGVARKRLHVLTDADDPIVDDADVGAAQRGAGAVSQLAADDRRRARRADLAARERAARCKRQPGARRNGRQRAGLSNARD